MNILETLINLLKQDERLVSTEGDLLKNKIQELANKLDEKLIGSLYSNETMRTRFFKQINEVWLFDSHKFIRFINNKEFLADSYTAFKNKIGLVDNKDEFIYDKNDVVLNRPYKDCVLEGGQSKEDQKRKEIFFNEILAQDEIDRLLDPKILTNWKRYSKDNEKPVKEINRDVNGIIKENIIIKGNNLLALHSLKKEFKGKIKMIYIDPPYNTSGDNNTFAYNNTFNHSTWLTFMKNRLEIAKELLSSNGVLAVAIDDEEYAHLKVLCDDIFKRENFIGTIIVQSNPRGRTTNTYFATSHEYTLFYGKNISEVEINYLKLTKEQELDFGNQDDVGDYRLLPFRRSGGTSTPKERANSEFSLYYSKSKENIIAIGGKRKFEYPKEYVAENILLLDDSGNLVEEDVKQFLSKHINDIVEIMPIDGDGKRRVWRWADRLEILKAAKAGDFNVVTDKSKYTVQLKDRIKDGRKPKTIWSDSKYDASSNGTMLLKKLFNGEKVFSYPKSIHAVRDTIEIITERGGDDIVLDFFGGSGTTAQAVLELNKDGGNRKFILVEQMDYINTVTCPRVQKVIEKENFIYCELKKYNQDFIDQIQNTKDTKELLKIWNNMKSKGFLDYNADLAKQDESVEEFKQLSLAQQKQILIELLDKNQLYMNLSEMNDKTNNVSKEDMVLTNEFYK